MKATLRGPSRSPFALACLAALGLSLAATGCEKKSHEVACDQMLALREKAGKEADGDAKKTCLTFFQDLAKKQSIAATDCTYAQISAAKSLIEAENGGYMCNSKNGGAATPDEKSIEAALDIWDKGVFGDSPSRKKQVASIEEGAGAHRAKGIEACVTECKTVEAAGGSQSDCMKACKAKNGL